ncbi:MAG: hypothetical protein ACLP5V_08670 [Candidatus Bathyarchaeia archaeon]
MSSCVTILTVIGMIFLALPTVHATSPITLDSITTKDNSGLPPVSTISWSHTVSSGATILIVGLSENTVPLPPNVMSVTFGGTSLSLLGRENGGLLNPTSPSHVELWFLLNPPAVTATVTLTLISTETAVVVGAASFFNVIGTTAFTGSNDQMATVTIPSITVPAVAGDLAIDVLATCSTACGNSATAPTPITGSTTYVSSEINGNLFAAASSGPAASPVTLSWAYTSHDWAMGGVALIPASPIPEYPFGLPILAIFMLVAYGLIRRRTPKPRKI